MKKTIINSIFKVLFFLSIFSCSNTISKSDHDETTFNDSDTTTKDGTVIDSDLENNDEVTDSDHFTEVFFCDPEKNCPEIKIIGDPLDKECLGVDPCPIRGYYDPSLETDAEGKLWMTYTRGTLIPFPEIAPDGLAVTHDIHIALSTDKGKTWEFDQKLIPAVKYDHPDHGYGLLENEISTIVRTTEGEWILMWLKYFEWDFETSALERDELIFSIKKADSPNHIKAAEEIDEIFGIYHSDLFPPRYDIPGNIPEMSDCAALTEPALFSFENETYLAVECIVLTAPPELEKVHTSGRVELLRMTENAYEYIGTLTDYEDAISILPEGGDMVGLTQPDISLSRKNGKILLILTPVNNSDEHPHQGCVVLGIENIRKARILRDSNNKPVVLSRIESYSDQLGPGLCTYDPGSETGIIITRMSQNNSELRVSIHETGIHPDF